MPRVGAPAMTWLPLMPIGLPWLGAHVRLDALSAFFLIVINLGGAAASLFAMGYGQHEESPGRVLPFYPAYLAAMNVVVLANDAFSFLVAWEFMSLSSWALVVSHHREGENVRAGYVYLLMASFGTLALLLAFGVRINDARYLSRLVVIDPQHLGIGTDFEIAGVLALRDLGIERRPLRADLAALEAEPDLLAGGAPIAGLGIDRHAP